jgi:hypothetical protein
LRINRDSRAWIVVCVLILAAATAVYIPYAQEARKAGGTSGGTWYGIIYGSVGSAMMLFALLLGLKKSVRTLRIGRAYWWLQGHVWFGLLSYPIILYHAGFRWGGPFTQVLMWMFTIVVVSGIIGIIIQQYMPTKMLRDVKYETIYDQIDRVLGQLQEEADGVLKSIVGGSGGEAFEVETVPVGAATATLAQSSVQAARTVSEFYAEHVKPYLARQIPANTPLKTEAAARVAFDQVRSSVPMSMQEPINDLAAIVEERRQLAVQKHMHHLLHGWLIVHVPLSYGLMVLAAVHAVAALRYVSPHW